MQTKGSAQAINDMKAAESWGNGRVAYLHAWQAVDTLILRPIVQSCACLPGSDGAYNEHAEDVTLARREGQKRGGGGCLTTRAHSAVKTRFQTLI